MTTNIVILLSHFTVCGDDLEPVLTVSKIWDKNVRDATCKADGG